MAFSTKGKRKIVLGKETFYWWIQKKSGGPRLHILGLNKKFNIDASLSTHELNEISLPDNTRGREISKPNPLLSRPFESVSPGVVRSIIEWYLGPDPGPHK